MTYAVKMNIFNILRTKCIGAYAPIFIEKLKRLDIKYPSRKKTTKNKVNK